MKGNTVIVTSYQDTETIKSAFTPQYLDVFLFAINPPNINVTKIE